MRMKMKMRCVSLFLMVCIMATSIPEIAFAAESKGKEVSVEAGDTSVQADESVSPKSAEPMEDSGEKESGDYRYTVHKNDAGEDVAVITGWSYKEAIDVVTTLTIPGEIDGFKVVGIGAGAFCYTAMLTSVSIPEGVTDIGKGAFSNSNLESITVAPGNTVYDSRDNCNAIIDTASNTLLFGCKNTVIPNSIVSIGECAFDNCYGLTDVNIPEGVVSIGERAFLNCGQLTSVELPGSLKEMGDFAFCGSGLVNVKLSEGTEKIGGHGVFQSCRALEQVELPESLVEIGENTFYECKTLKSIELPGNMKVIGATAFYGCSSLESVKLPESLQTIGESAFAGCSALTNIELPNSLQTIGGSAFAGCSALTNIELPEGLTEIEGWVFNGCGALESVKLPENLREIGEYAFHECSSLQNIELPVNLRKIGKWAFYGCGLVSLELPESLTEMDYDCFGGNKNLVSVKIPEGMKVLGEGAFSGCESLTDVELPASLEEVGYIAFSGCKALEHIELPAGLKEIQGNAFEGTGLTSIELPEEITVIRNGVFGYCKSLTNVKLPAGLTAIEGYTFGDCSALTSINLPSGVTKLGEGAFSRSSLISIELPSKLTEIGRNAFSGCSNLGSITLPPGLSAIEGDTFSGCSALTGIELPSGVTKLGDSAFSESGLTSIELPEGLTEIGRNAFSGCSALESIKLPGVKKIGDYAFSESGLKSIELPECLEAVAPNVFRGCSDLKRVKLSSGVVGEAAFFDCSSLVELELYEGVARIESTAFSGCSSLTHVRLPESLEEIQGGAFDRCESLTSVVCPVSLTNIGDNAFTEKESDRVISENLTLVVPRGAYAETYAVEHSIPYSYRTDVGEADLQVKLISGNVADLQGLRLVIRGKDYYMARSLTAESEYQFSRLMAGKSYTVSVENAYGDAVSSVKDVELQTGENSVELTDFKALSSVNARVLTQEGKEVTAGCNIEWLDETGGIYAGGTLLERIPVGRNLSCRVNLNGTLGRSYVAPADITWTVSARERTCTVTLLPFQKVRLKGIVVTENGAASEGAVSFVQKLNGKYDANTFIRTNSEGAFELEAYNQPGVLTVKCRGYKPYTLNVEDLSKDKDLGSILLEELTGTTITVNAAYAKRPEEDSQAVFQTLSTLDDLSFEIKNEVTGLSVDDYFQQDCSLILPEGVGAGDTLSLTVKSRSDDFAPVESTVTVGSENKAEVSLQLVQRGAIRISCQKGENDSVCLLIYDESGKQVWRGTYKNGRFVLSKGLPDGNYTVVAIGDSPYFSYPVSWKGLQDLGLKQGADYVSAQAAVSAGKATDVLFWQVPLFSDEAYSINDLTRTRFSLSRTETSLGRYVSLRGMAPLKKEYEGRVQDLKWIFEIPEECEIMDGSLIINTEVCTNVSREGRELIVSSINSGDMVCMCLLPVLPGQHTINGALEYTMDGRTIRQPIGSLDLKVESSFKLPQRVMTKNVTASGITTPSSGVSLYDNGVLVGQTTASLSGSWAIDFELYQPYSYSEHKIYAESETVDGRAVRTETKTLTYQYIEKPVSVKRVTMLNGSNVIYFFDEEKQTVGSYSYSPSYPSFTFVVEMTGDDLSEIENLKLHVLCSDGKMRVLSPRFDKEKQQWIASALFYSNSLPKNVDVSFGLEAPVSYSVEEQKDTDDAWKVITRLAERKIFTKVTLPANVKVSEETQEAYDDYNQAVEDMQEACKDLTSVIKDIEGTETGATVQMDGVSLTGTELPAVPSVSQIEQEGYVAVPTTDSNTQVYQKLEAAGDDAVSGGFLIITREPGNVTAKEVEVNVMDTSRLEKDLNRVVEAGSEIPDAINRLSNAAVSAQKATKKEIEQVKATAGDAEDFGKAEFLTMLESLLDGFFESETVACVMRNPSPLNCKGIEAISKTKYLSKSFFQVFNFINNFQELAEAASHYEYIKKLSVNCLSGMKNCDCLAMLKNAHLCYIVVKILVISGLTDLVGTVLSVVFPGFGFLGKFLLATGVTALDFWANRTVKKHYGHLNGSCRKCNIFTGKCKICDVCEDDPEDDGDDFGNDFWEKSNEGSVASILIDPSGYVYEAVSSNRLAGVTATCYEKVTKYDIYDEPYEEIQLWDASLYEQQNPLLTNADGYYAWDVPQGLWQVGYEKEGYETAASEWMEVPPPRFDVNVGLVSYEEPGLEEVLAYPEDIEFSFSKYVKVDTVTGETVHVLAAGKEIAGTLKPLNEEDSPADGTMLATQFAFVPDSKLAVGTAVTVKATAGILTYAGVSPEKELTSSKNVVLKPEKLEVTQRLALDYKGEGTLEIAALPTESAAGMEVAVTNDSPMVLEVQEDKVTLDKQGKAVVHVKALLPGECAVRFALSGSRLNAQSTVSIANMAGGNGEPEVEVKKTPIDDGSCSVTLSGSPYTYDGKKKEPSVTVKNASSALAEGADYTVTYKNNLNAGTATAIITGIGSYTGTLEKTFKINKAKTTIKASDVTKTASKKKITFSVKAKSSGGGTLTYSSNNKSVKIDKKGKVTIAKNFVGKAVITIKMAASANYEAASKKITVKVNPAGVKLTSVKSASSGKLTVKWKKNAKVTGYEIQYSTSKKFVKSAAKTKKVKKAAKTSETISKLKKGKTYYVRIRTYKKVSGKMYYSGWSSKKNVKIRK